MTKTSPLITPKVAMSIIRGETDVSLDLGLTIERIHLDRDNVIIRESKVSHKSLSEISEKKDSVFFIENSDVFQVAISKKHFYKLVPTEAAPTIEIDGIRMHRTSGITPEKDAKEKIAILDLAGGKVLDTCTGLGYTASIALEKKTELIVSCERESSVLRIAQINPWSAKLFGSDIHVILSDIFFSIGSFPDSYYDYIIHDPPRFSLAGHLYSEEFYKKMFKVMTIHAKMFHYVGEPGSKYRGADLKKGVIKRLNSVGFRKIQYHRNVLGVTCEKPSVF